MTIARIYDGTLRPGQGYEPLHWALAGAGIKLMYVGGVFKPSFWEAVEEPPRPAPPFIMYRNERDLCLVVLQGDDALGSSDDRKR